MIDVKENLLDEWKERLGLQDWVIFLRINCKTDEFKVENPEDHQGEVEWTLSCKSAVIKIADMSGLEDAYVVPFDLEKALVHELLHLKFAYIQSMTETEAEYQLMHGLIDDLARALVNAKRGQTERSSCGDVFIDRLAESPKDFNWELNPEFSAEKELQQILKVQSTSNRGIGGNTGEVYASSDVKMGDEILFHTLEQPEFNKIGTLLADGGVLTVKGERFKPDEIELVATNIEWR